MMFLLHQSKENLGNMSVNKKKIYFLYNLYKMGLIDTNIIDYNFLYVISTIIFNNNVI